MVDEMVELLEKSLNKLRRRMEQWLVEMLERSLNKLRRRMEQWLRKGRGIQGGREGYRRDTRILKWGKEMKQDSTNGGEDGQ